MSWFLWFPNNAQFVHILAWSSTQMISSFLLCSGHCSLSERFSSVSPFREAIRGNPDYCTCCYYYFVLVFSTNLSNAKFLGYSSAELLREQLVLYHKVKLGIVFYLSSGQWNSPTLFLRRVVKQAVQKVCPHSGKRRGTKSPTLEYYLKQMPQVSSSNFILFALILFRVKIIINN